MLSSTPNLFYKSKQRHFSQNPDESISNQVICMHGKWRIYRKEFGFIGCPEEYDSHKSKISTKDNAGCENLFQLPTVRDWRWLYPVF